MLQRFWTTATQGHPLERIAVWVGIAVVMGLSSFLPMWAGLPVRAAAIGIAFALVAAALAPHQTRNWQRLTRFTLGGVWVYVVLTAAASSIFGEG